MPLVASPAVHSRRALTTAVLAIVFAGAIPPGAATSAASTDPEMATLSLFGAWSKSTLKVEWRFSHPAYPAAARQAVTLWETLFPALHFELPPLPDPAAPPPPPAPDVDVLLTDVAEFGGYACTIPDCSTGYLLRTTPAPGIVCSFEAPCPPFLRGEIRGPVIVLLPALVGGSLLTTNAERFNFAAHEFGHAIGLGHTSTEFDAMNQDLHGARRCLSNLDLDGLKAAYGFLPGPFGEPPLAVSIPAESYNGRLLCSAGGAPPSLEQTLCHAGVICCKNLLDPLACQPS